MVFFCCDGCSETLKKRQVDNHAARCRVCVSVSCVDCNVSFFGDDYRTHTTCITEAERYEGKKPKVKSSPQDAWMDMIGESVDKAPGHLRDYLLQMVTLSNVPRKAKAFRNFTANSLNLRGKSGDATVTELWDFLQKIRDEQRKETDSGRDHDKNMDPKPQPLKENGNKVRDVNSGTTTNAAVQLSETNRIVEVPMEQKLASPVDRKTVDMKTVKKAMKKLLKKHQSLTVKAIRKEVRVKLGNPSKSKIKELVQAGLNEYKVFELDGRNIKLKVTH